MVPVFDAVSRFVRAFAGNERGNIAIIFGLALIPLALFIGAGVDIGRWLHARERTIAATDAAVLAGARALQLDRNNSAAAILAAEAFYSANVKGRLRLLSDTITFAPDDDNTAFRSNGNAYIETPFLALANIKSLPLLKSDGSEYSKAVLSSGGQSETSIEISLMLDVTGSMRGRKFTDMKIAAKDLVNIVMTGDNAGSTVKTAIVPFAEGVRLPSSANAAARGNPAKSVKVKGSKGNITYDLTPCVAERTGSNRYTDAAPRSGSYVLSIYGSCTLSSRDEVLPLTADKDRVLAKIDSLDLANMTAGQIGTAWAWYVLSPKWNSLWPSSSAGAYNPDKLQKIAVLMTDGEYNTQYDAKGIKTGEQGAGPAANGDSTSQARALCEAMKTAGITIYTVGFDLGGNSKAISTLRQCASDETKFYNTTTGDQLKQAFRDIALKINQLYLTH